MRIAAACLAKSLLRPFRAASGGGRRCLDLGDGRWRRSFSPRANRPQWGKPNTRVTGRKLVPVLVEIWVIGGVPECPEFARNFVFRSGDTESSHFWCGNRPMPAQCLPLVRLSSLLRNRHLPNPLAAARYFAAGDTSVGFTPTATALELPRSLPSRIPAMRAGSAISRSATTTSAPCSAIRATWQGRSRATATALELSRSGQAGPGQCGLSGRACVGLLADGLRVGAGRAEIKKRVARNGGKGTRYPPPACIRNARA